MKTFHNRNASLSAYIYDVQHSPTDRLARYLAATPIYTVGALYKPGHLHVTQRAVGVLLHKLGVRL